MTIGFASMAEKSKRGLTTAMSVRKLPGLLWMALTLLLLAGGNRPVHAGPGFLVLTRDNGADDTILTDDTIGRKRLKFDTDTAQRFFIYRPVPGAVSQVLDPGVNTNLIEDDDIKEAIDAAVNEWNDQDTDLELLPSLYSEDGAIPGFDYLERGPFEIALDARNTISFRDANNDLADGVLFMPVYWYFESDYEIQLNQDPNGAISIGTDPLDSGELVTGVFTSTDPQFNDLAFLLKAKLGDVVPAGELIETDLLFDSTLTYNLYPQDENELPNLNIRRQDVLGTLDIGAIATKAIGRGIGLAESYIFASTLSPYYILPGDVNDLFETDPYAVRKLSLDDKSGVIKLYNGDKRGSIAGSLLQGSNFQQEGANDGTNLLIVPNAVRDSLANLPDEPVFVGQPVPHGEPINLDTVFSGNSRFGQTERFLGPIKLMACDLTGPEQTFFLTSPDVTVAPGTLIALPANPQGLVNSDYEIPALPSGHWYELAKPRDSVVTFQNSLKQIFRTLDDTTAETFTIEWFGGVSATAPLMGEGNVGETTDTDTLIGNSYIQYIPEFVPVIFIDPVTQIETPGFAPTGRFFVQVANGMAITREEPGEFAVGLLTTDLNAPAIKKSQYLDDRGRGFGGNFGYVQEYNEQTDKASLLYPIFDTLGASVGLITQEFEILADPSAEEQDYLGPITKPQAVKVTWTYTNLASPRVGPNQTIISDAVQSFGFANQFKPGNGAPFLTPPLYIRGERQNTAKEFTGSDIPNAVYWDDTPSAPMIRAGVFTKGTPNVTVPDSLILSNLAEATRTKLFDYVPRGAIDGPVLGATELRRGIIIKFNPRIVAPGESVSFSTLVAYQNLVLEANDAELTLLRRVENGIAQRYENDPLADDPTVAFPLTVDNNRLFPVTIITNDTLLGTQIGQNDADNDGIDDSVDNCPYFFNPDQSDQDGDGTGDVCTGDKDSDQIPDAFDNCPNTPNPLQEDFDQDGIGDVCDTDRDGDGVPDIIDNCPTFPNPGQEDSDGDGIGDNCDGDSDFDGVPDEIDNCPAVFNPFQEDTDGDGIGDACDNDRDNDGVPDATDNCPDTPNADQLDTNGDGIGDVCDPSLAIFTDETASRVPVTNLSVSRITPGDVNLDGYMDFVVAINSTGATAEGGLINRIFLNRGSQGRPGVFYDATFGENGTPEDSGTTVPGGDDRLPIQLSGTYSAVLFDFDMDGDLDIYFCVQNSTDGQSGGVSRLLINYDENDLSRNPFADSDDLGDGFYKDVTDFAIPGVNNTKDAARQYFYERPQETGCTAVDIDGDGDLDLVLASRFSGVSRDPLTGGLPSADPGDTVYGWTDLEGSFQAYGLIDTDPGTAGVQTPFGVPTFGTRILINRRNEVVDNAGTVVPIGTPDAFIFQQATYPAASTAVFNPNVPPSEFANVLTGGGQPQRRVDKFWFRDESLGRDGLFGGGGASQDISQVDRVQMGYPDIPQVAQRGSTNRQDEGFDQFQVIATDLGGLYSPDIYTLNSYNPGFGNGILKTAKDGIGSLFINFDLLDENGVIRTTSTNSVVDGIDDGYFFDPRWGTELWIPKRDDLFGSALMGAGEGLPFDITINENGESAYNLTQTFSRAGVAADTYGGSSIDLIVAGSGGTTAQMYRVSRVTENGNLINNFRNNGRGFNGRPLTGTGSPYSNTDTRPPVATTFDTQDDFVETATRNQDVDAADFNRDGGMDIVTIGDGPANSAYNALVGAGGSIGIYSNALRNGQRDTWVDQSAETLPVIAEGSSFKGTAIRAFDIDNDSDADLVIGTAEGLRIYVNQRISASVKPNLESNSDIPLFMDATHQFIPSQFGSAASPTDPSQTGSSGSTSAIASGDIDRDGRLDLVIGGGVVFSTTGDRTFVLKNRGPNMPGAPYFLPTTLGNPAPRLATEGYSPGSSDGTALDFINRPTSDLLLFDIDGDGDEDILQTNFGQATQVYFNKDARDANLFEGGQGNLIGRGIKYYNSMTNYDVLETRVQQANANANGFSQFVIQNSLLGDGIFERAKNELLDFQILPDLTGPGNRQFSRSAAIGDVDGDGRVDILLCNGITNGGAQNVLLMNRLQNSAQLYSMSYVDESNTRLPQVTIGPNEEGTPFADTYSAAFVDVDNDGDLDIILGNATETSAGASGPAFIKESELLVNDGTGVFTRVIDQDRFPILRSQVRRVLVGNFANKGDIAEDQDGNGVVSDKEAMQFKNTISNLTANGHAPAVFDVPSNRYTIRVTETVIDSTNPNRTFVTQRPPQFINLNNNFNNGTPIFDPVYDVILVCADGSTNYLSNDGSGSFSDFGPLVFADLVGAQLYNAEAGDLNNDGWLDIVFAESVAPTQSSGRVLINLQSTGVATFRDVTATELLPPYSTIVTAGGDPATGTVNFSSSDPRGNARAVELFDADNDGDLDLYVGEAGRTIGARSLGAIDAFYENRWNGAGYNSRTGLYKGVAPNAGPIINPMLSVTSVSPSVVAAGQTLDLKVYGKKFKGGAEISFGQGISIVQAPIVRSSELIEVRVRVSDSAAVGGRLVFVFNPDGETAVSSTAALQVGVSINTPANGKSEVREWMLY